MPSSAPRPVAAPGCRTALPSPCRTGSKVPHVTDPGKESARPAGRRSAWCLPGRRLRGALRRRTSNRYGSRAFRSAQSTRPSSPAIRDKRVERLRDFWDLVSSRLTLPPLAIDDASRKLFNETSAALVASTGAPGFFDPRYPPAVVMPPGTREPSASTTRRRSRTTLLELVDFDLLNSGRIRLSVGAVDVRNRKSEIFRHARETRSAPSTSWRAAPCRRAFRPSTIDGEPYWDGGLVSNTPLQYVLDGERRRAQDMCMFQIDLFSAKGPIPETLFDVQAAREGHPLLQPHALQHRRLPQNADHAPRHSPA